MKRKAGFTLIEIMVSLVLVGLIAAIAGTSVITATRSYLFARENDAITQKAQLAIGRLNREFIELSDVKAVNGSQPYLIYEVPSRTAGVLAERRAVAKVGNTVQLFKNVPGTDLSGLTGDTLIDGVQSFSILYNPNPNSTLSLWSMGQDIRNLFAVNVQFVLSRPDTGGTVPFYLTVSPRNNNNSGGASLPTTSNPPPEYSGRQCFVTTAAYGDADHPVVVLLRQFRDRALLPTGPGKALVRYYYEVGPSLAAAIEDKPIACLLVRLLVTPLAGFALLSMSCPILIPLILLLSWGLARLVLRELRRRSLRRAPSLQGQRGAMLVTLIATLVVFSTLGAIMIGMFGTSALSQVAGNNSMKAYYLAESGFRYAASSYINVSGADEATRETARDNLLETELHGKTFSLAQGDGGFRIDAYPYYYKVSEVPSSNQLRTRVTGGFPLEGASYNNGSWVQVTKTDGSTENVQISGVSLHTYAGYNEVRFWTYSGSPWPSIAEGAPVMPVCIPDRATLTVNDLDGDGLIDYIPFVASSGAAAFPARNGIFAVNVMEGGVPKSRLLSYRELDITNRRLKGIGDPSGLPLTSLTLQDPGTGPSYTKVIELTKFIRLESTGTFGAGSSAVSRKATYYAPIGYARATPIDKTEFKDSFADLSKWYTGYNVSHAGTQTLSSMYGGIALMVSGLAATGPSYCLNYGEFQIGLNWSGANIPLSTEWLRASRYLSYDVQVKMSQFTQFGATSQAFGLNFRLDESGNSLGLNIGAFEPGLNAGSCEKDYIPEGMIAPGSGYTDRTPVITLWAKQYDKKDSAFTVVPNPGPEGCLWHPPTTTGHYTIRPTNLAAWETGNRVRLAPAGGGALPGGIVENRDYFTRKITTSGVDYIYLFDSRSDALAKESGCWLWSGLQDMTNAGSGARTATNQNGTYTNLAHQTLTTGNGFLGLSSSQTSMPFIKNWSTGLVRLIEAPSVSVVNGGGTTGSEIRSGDTVYATIDNTPAGSLVASARVRRNPVYRSASAGVRNWSGSSAEAVLILEVLNPSGTSPLPHVFGQGKTLFVGEHPSGRNAGIVGIPGGSTDIVYRSRDNWIAVYLGDITGKEPLDADPYDLFRGPLLRTSVRWPVDAVEDTISVNDYFTIVRFESFLNSSLLCKVDGLDMSGTNCLSGFYSKTNTGTAPDILRFSSPDGVVFNSPSSGSSLPASRAEVGLNAYAVSSIFYDDFALLFGPGYGITRQGFLLPIQQ